MSRPGGAGTGGGGKKPIAGGGHHPPLSDRFREALALDADKPDSKNFQDLGSPDSPLRHRGANITNTTSSSSSSSGSISLSLSGKPPPAAAAAGGGVVTARGRRSHSGELSGSSDSSPTSHRSHRRTGSNPHVQSGGSPSGRSGSGGGRSGSGGGRSSSGGGRSSSASSPVANVLPAGNICPSGIIARDGSLTRTPARHDVLGRGGNYGHGTVVSGYGTAGSSTGDATVLSGDSEVRRAMASMDPEEVSRAANEQYKRGQFSEALRLYDRVIALCPGNVACRSNRAAALSCLGRLGDAVKEYQEAVRIDPSAGRAHQRLAAVLLRLGQVEDARRHSNFAGQLCDPVEMRKLQAVEGHLARCENARRVRDWKSALREVDAAVAVGVDSSPLLMALRAEALLRLHQLKEADSTLSSALKLELLFTRQSRCFGMLLDAYIHIVHAQVDMALGRFENAVTVAEKAQKVDPRNVEVGAVLNKIRSVTSARALGNDFFKIGNFAEACTAYGEGLKYDPSNSVLRCNRAACRSKLGQWEKCIEDCNEALRIQPNYTKALLRRAASYTKLERWAESVRDYEVLRKELPGDTEVAEALFHAEVALKTSRGEDVSNLKFGGEVEQVTGPEQFKAAISLPGVSVVYFMDVLDQQCIRMTPVVDSLCSRYPSLYFLKVNIKESREVTRDENVLTVPTFKIYKNGTKVKELIRPNQQMLEYSVKHYST